MDEDDEEYDESHGLGYIHIHANSPYEALEKIDEVPEGANSRILEDTSVQSWGGWNSDYHWELNDDDELSPYLQDSYAEGGDDDASGIEIIKK